MDDAVDSYLGADSHCRYCVLPLLNHMNIGLHPIFSSHKPEVSVFDALKLSMKQTEGYKGTMFGADMIIAGIVVAVYLVHVPAEFYSVSGCCSKHINCTPVFHGASALPGFGPCWIYILKSPKTNKYNPAKSLV